MHYAHLGPSKPWAINSLPRIAQPSSKYQKKKKQWETAERVQNATRSDTRAIWHIPIYQIPYAIYHIPYPIQPTLSEHPYIVKMTGWWWSTWASSAVQCWLSVFLTFDCDWAWSLRRGSWTNYQETPTIGGNGFINEHILKIYVSGGVRAGWCVILNWTNIAGELEFSYLPQVLIP